MKIRYSLIILSLLSLNYNDRYREAISLPVNSVTLAAACPVLDDSHLVIEPSTCNGSDGAISGIVVTGTTGMVRYIWYDLNNKEVSESTDLTGVPTGYYRVEVRDESKCPIIKSRSYLVGIKNAVTIDNANTVITTPTCNGKDGSITKVNAVNATQYQWTDQNNVILSSTKDLTNVAAGTYTLTASNVTGCSSQYVYTITNGLNAPAIIDTATTAAECNGDGTFTATFDLKPTDPNYIYYIDRPGAGTVASGGIAYNPTGPAKITAVVSAGTYTLFALSPTNCLAKIFTFTINQAQYAINTDHVVIHPDICGQKVGAIVGLEITGGAKPYKGEPPSEGYFWTDSTGTRIPGFGFLSSVPAGKYYLTVINKYKCKASASFIIPDSISPAFKPVVNPVNLCLPGMAILNVINKDAHAVYHLYDATETIIDSNRTGYFVQKVDNTSTFYISGKSGICESPQTSVTVNVAAPGVVIPNAFTPNNDGVNDYWAITGLEKLPGTDIKVFNRDGALVYHSINYSQPFTGQYNGKNLPSGVYYYVIDLKKTVCKGGVSGSLTIIR